MTDKTQPEAGSTHIIRYALELGLLWIDGDGRNKVREALDALDAIEAKLDAVGAGGVQALSAAPAADIATAGELQAFEAWYKQDCAVAGAAAKMAAKSAWQARAALAASPTPPAEQPDLSRLTERGAVAWAGVDAQALREGATIAPELQAEARRRYDAAMEQAAPKAAPGKPSDRAAFFAWWDPYQLPDYWASRIDVVAWHAWQAAMTHAATKAAPQQEAPAGVTPAPMKEWCMQAAADEQACNAQFSAGVPPPQQEAQEPWGACVSGRVFVGGLPEQARKLAEAENLPIQWLYTAPQPAPAPAELEQLKGRISRIGLDIDRALHGQVNEQSPVGAGRLAAIAALAAKPAPAPLSEREAFEAWIKKDGGDLGTFGTPPNMHYRSSAVNNAWVAWKARAALAAQGGK